MDFQIIGEDTLKIKNKKVNLAIDPRGKVTKFEAEAILLTDDKSDTARVNDFRIIIEGPGEYEVSGLKITGIKSDSGVIYELISESANALLARASALTKISADKLDDYKIVIINADADLNETLITAMEPRIIVLYGMQSKEAAKKLGKEGLNISSKISITEDKLPDEQEVMLLG